MGCLGGITSPHNNRCSVWVNPQITVLDLSATTIIRQAHLSPSASTGNYSKLRIATEKTNRIPKTPL